MDLWILREPCPLSKSQLRHINGQRCFVQLQEIERLSNPRLGFLIQFDAPLTAQELQFPNTLLGKPQLILGIG